MLKVYLLLTYVFKLIFCRPDFASNVEWKR